MFGVLGFGVGQGSPGFGLRVQTLNPKPEADVRVQGLGFPVLPKGFRVLWGVWGVWGFRS